MCGVDVGDDDVEIGVGTEEIWTEDKAHRSNSLPEDEIDALI